MLITLIKIRFRMLFNGILGKSKDKGKKATLKVIGFTMLGIYLLGVFCVMSGMLFDQICLPFHKLSIDWFYFGSVIILSFTMMFICTIFMTQSQIYEAKDNELLISMPIKASDILASRIITLLIVNFIYELIICIPAFVVYSINVGGTLRMGVCFLIIFLCLPFITMTITCGVAGLLEILSRRIKNKSIVITALSAIVLILYFSFISKTEKYIGLFIANGELIAGKIKSIVAPIYYMGQGIAQGNFLYIGMAVGIVIIISVIVYVILAKSFVNICTNKRGFKKVIYREKTLKANNITKSIVKKDLVHFYKSPMYMMNGAMGIIFVIAIPVILLVKKDMILAVVKQMPQFEPYFMSVIGGMIAMVNVTNIISAPSISLEGKNLWILRSMPISSKQIIDAKILMHLLICLPPTICAQVVVLFMVKASVMGCLILFLLPISVIFLLGVFGVMVNLHYPKMDWVSETVAVKQSASTMIVIFSGMGLVITMAAIYALIFVKFMNIQTYLLCVTVVFMIITAGIYARLLKNGGKLLEKI